MHNNIVHAQAKLAAGNAHVATEIPVGCPQIRYIAQGDQWVPRGQVLRCLIDDGGEDGGATITFDEHELSLGEFGRMLCTYAGWGMRITFVPEDEIGKQPTTEIRDVADDE